MELGTQRDGSSTGTHVRRSQSHHRIQDKLDRPKEVARKWELLRRPKIGLAIVLPTIIPYSTNETTLMHYGWGLPPVLIMFS